MPALAPDPGLVFGDVCVICQDDVTDRGRLDGCAHLFCVPCIVRWAEIETKCPLCKARFKVIYPEAYGEQAETNVSDGREGDGASPERTRGGTRRRGERRKPIRVVRRDQMYEDPDGDPLNGLDLDEVTCGTCGEGGDEDKLMLCDGCDAGHHCYCVGLETVPLEEWRCRICAGGEDAAGEENDEAEGSARTVATVRAQITHDASHDAVLPSAEEGVSPRREARLAARRRAASLRAARFSSRIQTPESRASSDARARAFDLDEGVALSFETSTTVTVSRRRTDSREGTFRSRSRAFAFRSRDGSGADTDARRRQVARVRELRAMWDRYRAGEIAFDGFCAAAGTTTTRTHANESRPSFGDDVGGDPGGEGDRPYPSVSNPGGGSESVSESVAEKRRRAAAATLAAVGWSGGGGEACLANAPGRVFSGETNYPYERLPSDGGGRPPDFPAGGRLLKRARRREPLPAATRVSRASDEIRRDEIRREDEDEDEDENKKNASRRLPAALSLGGSRGGGSMSGSGPDRKGAFAGVAFSPPRRDAVPAEASGWTSSDEDEADARTPAAANPRALSPRRNEKEKAFLATRAIRFVPPGSVTHVPPAVSARDAEATRRAMLRDAEAAGAPDKARVIQMVKARLKPYWAGGADRRGGSRSGNRNIRTAEQFKRLAKRASASARAATAVAALKHGPDASADGAREEAIARAVQRAVDAALTREGIEVTRG